MQQTPTAIKGIGISQRKAEYIVGLAKGTADGSYDFDAVSGMTDEEVVAYLCKIPGVGTWTAEMIAEFTLGRLDIFSYGDAALRRHGESARLQDAVENPLRALSQEIHAVLFRRVAVLLCDQ